MNQKKKRNKGFTLIELLAVLVILSVIGMIAIPVILNFNKQTEDRYYKTLEGNIQISGTDYFSANRSLRPKDVLATAQVDLAILLQNKYIEPVVDAKGNDTCSGYVRALKQTDGKYNYATCLVCDGYRSQADICDADYDPNLNDRIYTLKVPSIIYSYYQLPINAQKVAKATLLARGKEVKKVEADGATLQSLNTNLLGTQSKVVKYSYTGEELGGTTLTGYSDLNIYQNPAPNVQLFKINTSGGNLGTYVASTWTNQNVKETFSSPTYREGKVYKYQIASSPTGPWTDYCTKLDSNGNCSSTIATSNVLEQTKYVRGVDEEGRVSAYSVYNVKIDKVKPTCSLKVSTGTLGDNNWYRSNVGISFATTNDTGSGIGSTGLTNASSATYNGSPSYSMTSNGTNTVYGYVMDKAGNTGQCSIQKKIDKDPPTCSISINGTVGSNGWYKEKAVTMNLSKSDTGGSGLNSGYGFTKSATASYSSTSTSLSQSDTSGTTFYGYVKDGAGNTASCSKSVKVDTVKPTFSGIEVTSPTGIQTAQHTITMYDSGSQLDKIRYVHCYNKIKGSTNIGSKSTSCLAKGLDYRYANNYNEHYWLSGVNKSSHRFSLGFEYALPSNVKVRWYVYDYAGNLATKEYDWEFKLP